jgi:hypothetical protein
MKKKTLTRILCCFMLVFVAQSFGLKLMAQDDENIKTGWTFGALPAVS